MNEWGVFLVIVSLLGFLATLWGLISKFTTPFNQNIKATQELSKQVALLNASLVHGKELDSVRDNRLNSHSNKLDKLNEGFVDHESRIKFIENTNYIKKYEN